METQYNLRAPVGLTSIKRAKMPSGCLEAGLDAADTIKAENSVEQMLSHQMAAAPIAQEPAAAGGSISLPD